MKHKTLSLISSVAIATLMLAGCGQSSPTNHSTQSSSTNSAATKSAGKEDHQLWNKSKDQQLSDFMDKWAPTMGQSYVKYDGSHDIRTKAGMHYPSELSDTTVNGSKASIGWSDNGNGSYEYNVVALYNYDRPGNAATHITYAFAFHNGQPVALVEQSTNGTANWTPTKNADVESNFERIANSNGSNFSASNKKSPSSDTKVSPDQIAVMIYQYCYPDDDVSKEADFGTWSNDGKQFVGNGGPVSIVNYSISGDTVTYAKKSQGSYPTTKTISVKELISKQYSTPSQKQTVDQVAATMVND